MTSRRSFIKASGSLAAMPWFASQSMAAEAQTATAKSLQGNWIEPAMTREDKFSVATGFGWNVIAKTGDRINKKGEKFGDCSDFTTFLPGKNSQHGYLWVNHEAVTTNVLYGKRVSGKDKTKAMVDQEMAMVGGSYLEIKRNATPKSGWHMIADSTAAFRVDAHTEIPLVGVAGGKTARGTCANCSGGQTPWGSILTCEENFDEAWDKQDAAGWSRFYDEPLERYGWVVEVDPRSKKARKLTGLGRFAHEGAWVHVSADKKIVVYMGDDAKFERLYKFVSHGTLTGDHAKDRDLLLEGTLYVANLTANRWEVLSLSNPKLRESGSFKDEGEVMTQARAAAALVGGTPLARPEGITMDPRDGRIYISLTNNDQAGDFFGSILVISETDGDHTGTSFEFDTFFAGSVAGRMVCPDNLATGPAASLWVTNDISGSKLGKSMYKPFPRNGLYRMDQDSGGIVRARCFALAPVDAELTGPWFHPSGDDLFLCIQHPGELSYAGTSGLTSHWPAGGISTPASAVVSVFGESKSFV